MDKSALLRALDDIPKKMDLIEEQMQKISEKEFLNPRSPKQLQEVIFDKWNFPKVKERSTDKDCIAIWKEMYPYDDELTDEEQDVKAVFISKLLDHRQLTKINGTYMSNFARAYRDGRGHVDIKLFGTVTGRCTGNELNPLVIPRESRGDLYKSVKDIFLADEGTFMLASDYKGMELRTLQYCSQDPWLLETLSDPNADFHKAMAREMFPDFNSMSPDKQKEIRVIAKMLVFGLNYGRRAKSIAEQMKTSISEAQQLIDKYYKPIPKVREWTNDTIKLVRRQGYLENCFGRRRRFPLITRESVIDVEKQAINFLPSLSER